MTYYRVARKNDKAVWSWFSTRISSLGAVYGFFQFYSFIPMAQLSVFMSSSLEEFDKLLEFENNGESVSVPAEQFLMQKEARMQEKEQSSSEEDSTSDLQPAEEQRDEERRGATEQAGEAVTLLERKRLEIEAASGDDHDQPYLFQMPVHVPTMLAWLRLREKRQNGEISS